MLYLRICFDKPNSAAFRQKERIAHRTYTATFMPEGGPVRVVQGGPMCIGDTDEPNLGSFMVIEADSMEAVQRFHENDPFTKLDLFGRVDIIRWDRHIGNGETYVPDKPQGGH